MSAFSLIFFARANCSKHGGTRANTRRRSVLISGIQQPDGGDHPAQIGAAPPFSMLTRQQ
ncbi:MAG: hypothetical protein JO183_11215 [Ktedonobacteraceae bacterium]|nr:hypothetical protein [Ktedonobacteraceae bacterium]